MRMWAGAVALAVMSPAAEAATMGYQWQADDGSLSMFVEGESWDAIVAEGSRILHAFSDMLDAEGSYAGVSLSGVSMGVWHWDGEDQIGDCEAYVFERAYADLDWASGDLTETVKIDVKGQGDACAPHVGRWTFETIRPGTWFAVGLSAGDETQPPAPVPLPASAALLGVALAGLGLTWRRSRL